MGSGKTAVGMKIAKKLNMNFIDSDTEIINETGYSITELFNRYGEQHFRKKEEELIQKISKKNNNVIATGGGVVLNPKNMRNLRRNGFIINLQASVEILKNRLKKSIKNRPLLQSVNINESLKKYSEARSEFYKNNDFCIQTDNLSVDQIVSIILDILNLPNVRICASIAGEKPVEQLHQSIIQGASLVEFRFDLIKNPDIELLIQKSGLPVIATDRMNSKNLIRAINEGCDYIDIDIDNPEKHQLIQYAKEKNCKIIISIHDYEKTPTIFPIDNHEGDYLKIAANILSYEDSCRLIELLHQRKDLIIIGMGEKGVYMRIIAPLLGSFLTYASIKKSTAHGQLSVEEMVNIYKKMGLR
jgi:3-dehydroquinate dehydratase type I